jgi:hypothetical protein
MPPVGLAVANNVTAPPAWGYVTSTSETEIVSGTTTSAGTGSPVPLRYHIFKLKTLRDSVKEYSIRYKKRPRGTPAVSCTLAYTQFGLVAENIPD